MLYKITCHIQLNNINCFIPNTYINSHMRNIIIMQQNILIGENRKKERKLTHNPAKVRTLTKGPYDDTHTQNASHSDTDIETTHSMQAKRKHKNNIDHRKREYTRKYKTEICQNWKLYGKCPYKDTCSFAHGDDELKVRVDLPSNYKTKECLKYNETGFCPYGERCRFIHKRKVITLYTALLSENIRFIEHIVSRNPNFDLCYASIAISRPLSIFKELHMN